MCPAHPWSPASQTLCHRGGLTGSPRFGRGRYRTPAEQDKDLPDVVRALRLQRGSPLSDGCTAADSVHPGPTSRSVRRRAAAGFERRRQSTAHDPGSRLRRRPAHPGRRHRAGTAAHTATRVEGFLPSRPLTTSSTAREASQSGPCALRLRGRACARQCRRPGIRSARRAAAGVVRRVTRSRRAVGLGMSSEPRRSCLRSGAIGCPIPC